MFKLPETDTGFIMPVPERDRREGLYSFAFNSEVARGIKERDNWTCLCGNKADEGYRLHAAHKDHERRNPYYNHPDNGTTLCVECHLREHIHLLEESDHDHFEWAWHSVRLLAQGVWDDSFHTKGYKYRHRETLDEDRMHLLEVFDFYGMDVFDFIEVKD